MKTKKDVTNRLQELRTKYLADSLPAMSEETQRNLDYDQGYVDALEWVLDC